jgi:hypothetical protein
MISLIRTAADAALEESTTHKGFAGGDGWVISQGYAMHAPSAFHPGNPRLPT